jgi:hypothetical protein
MTTLIRIHTSTGIRIHTSTGQCIGHLLASRAGTWRCFNATDVELGTFASQANGVAAVLDRQQSEAIAA